MFKDMEGKAKWILTNSVQGSMEMQPSEYLPCYCGKNFRYPNQKWLGWLQMVLTSLTVTILHC